MAELKRTGVSQAFMKRSFMCRRTTAICDCWLDPAGVLERFPDRPSQLATLHQSHAYAQAPESHPRQLQNNQEC